MWYCAIIKILIEIFIVFCLFSGIVRHSYTRVSTYAWCPLWVNISLAGPGPMWAIGMTECSYLSFTGINLTGKLRSATQNIFVAWPHRNIWFNLHFVITHSTFTIISQCWYTLGRCILSLWKTRGQLPYTVNTMTVDALVMKEIWHQQPLYWPWSPEHQKGVF